ncbi:hypothetical protein IQ235_14610 [Oscillatoriales cyanobacterium LEGE 11467]|uniref:Uncharacterized protein n=1 Tax=Zarconia navalis LEGE 11467 TaxID=1828826 RepID=A0A928ZAU9_9CYAN|nr:hypothetical protein [Zarconia navalis]MBE9042011.1 hypothetical protein [Zarconia navalis LEGE 11467]
MIVKGTIERVEIGTGTWALKAEDGTTYELDVSAPDELLKPSLKVKVEGRVLEDVMTLAAIGPVLEVKSFEVLK